MDGETDGRPLLLHGEQPARTACPPPSRSAATSSASHWPPRVIEMTEHELAEADRGDTRRCARQQSMAAQHVVIAGYMAELGHDVVATRNLLEHQVRTPSPESVAGGEGRADSPIGYALADSTGGSQPTGLRVGQRAIRLQDLTAEHHLGRDAADLAGGRRHRRLRVRLDVRPLLSDLLRLHRPVPGGLDHADRAGPGHQAAAGRRARHRHPLPPPRRAGQHGRGARHHLRRPARTRHRRRLERGGVRRLRHRTGQHQGAVRPLRGGLRGADRPAQPRRRRPSTASTTSSRTRATSRRARSSRTRRSASAAAARSARCRSPRKYADHWNFVGGTPEEFAHKRDVLAARCADIGRDPKEITLSAHVRLGEDRELRAR